MSNFIQYIINKGYEPNIYDHTTKSYKPITNEIISSLGHVLFFYINKNDSSDIISYGLNEYGLPPTIVHPRPRIKVIRDEITEREDRDSSMNIAIQKETSEDIYNAIYDRSIVFEYDLTIKK